MLQSQRSRFTHLNRRRLLTILAGGGAALVSGAVNAAPERILRLASPGNSVIVTNPALLATDPGLPHAEELTRRLDLALRNRNILDHIARAKSRFFALSSVTLNGSSDPESLGESHSRSGWWTQHWNQHLCDFQTTLIRQGELVTRDFGPVTIYDLPAHAATSIDAEVIGPVLDTIVYCAGESGFRSPSHRKCIHGSDLLIIDDPHTRSGALDLIVLWPFNIET